MEHPRNIRRINVEVDAWSDLLDLDEDMTAISPAFGMVHRSPRSRKYRWTIIWDNSNWYRDSDDDPTYGEQFYNLLHGRDLATFAVIPSMFDMHGWLYTAAGWYVELDPDEGDEWIGRFADHPRRQHILQAVYMDHETGDIMAKKSGPDMPPETHRMPYPDEGWTIDNGGTVPAAMDLMRRAALRNIP